MIVLRQITLRRGAKVVLQDAGVTLNPGEKVGLVGRNGAGKSSLFALLAGRLHADAGDVEIPPRWRLGEVAQDMPETDDGATDFVLQGDQPLAAAQAELAAAEAADDGHAIAHAHASLDEAGAFDARARAQSLLLGLGFRIDQLDAPVNQFSGGWRMRLQLARALINPADLLLLDEPTNHLDLDALVWLEGWLQKFAGTMIVISHDREFLDAVTRVTVHVDQCALSRYGGNYTAFEEMRAERLSQQASAFSRQQERIAHLQRFIDRFKAKATKARQAQSRVKALARMEKLAPVLTESEFEITFREPANLPNPMLSLQGLDCGYLSAPTGAEGALPPEGARPGSGRPSAGPSAPTGAEGALPLEGARPGSGRPSAGPAPLVIVRGVDRTVLAGQRIGILGANGQGKSTLVKTIARALPPLAGQIVEGKGLAIGYFAQQEMDLLQPDDTPLQRMVRLARDAARDGASSSREQDLRNFLGQFRFDGDMVKQPVGTLSGGERARLVLAGIVWQRPNLLLLDEPTNHLDLATREALSIALNEFDGSVMLVSHDRALLREVCDEFWLVGRGGVVPFDGDLDDYQRWLIEVSRAVARGQPAPALPRMGPDVATPPSTPTSTAATPSPRAAAAPRPPPAPVPSARGGDDRKAGKQARARMAEQTRPLRIELQRIDARLARLQDEKAEVEAALAVPAGTGGADFADLGRRLAHVAAETAMLEERWLELQTELEALGT